MTLNDAKTHNSVEMIPIEDIPIGNNSGEDISIENDLTTKSYFGGIKGNFVKIVHQTKDYGISSAAFYKDNPIILKTEILSGVTVAVMQVPESIAFSFIAEISPIIGLYSTFFMGLITAAFGGKPGMISGIAGAMVIVLKEVTASDGELSHLSSDQRLEVAFGVVIFCGILQMLSGFLKIGSLVKMISKAVMIGFMNGLAIVIFMGQLDAFKSSDESVWIKIDDPELYIMFLYIGFTMVVMYFLPKWKRGGKIIPASLVGLVFGTIFEHVINRKFINYPVRTVGETATVSGPLPTFHLPSFSWTQENIAVIVRYGASLAAVGVIESVMTLQAVNAITGETYSDFKNNQECFAQGLGNLVSGIFGSVGGDAMIGQSTINVMNGASGRLSGIIASFALFLIILVANSIIELIPVASLTGVLFMVVISTFEWNCFPHYYWKIVLYFHNKNKMNKKKIKVPWQKIMIITLVTVLAVATNLAIAVLLGVALEAVIFANQNLSEFHKKDVEEVFSDLFHQEVAPNEEVENDIPIVYHHI